ncbi:major facilitator superfamily domain-containing protein [Apiospora arundinis]|uniref:Major facilitator superfamily domain-containing protein n=1 Tax=Apiospora arundinis TaxID=335852 RepID=A0ABR2IV22_9PEZI
MADFTRHTSGASHSPEPSRQSKQPAVELGQGSGEQRKRGGDTGEILYSVFTRGQKLWISSVTSFAGMLSTLCSYIYYPALVPIAEDLGVSLTMVNLTVTSYLVMAAIVPAVMGDLADQNGRRPVYILMFALFIGANVGIALQTSYPALFVLRMLQSAGSSGLIAISYGVIADITTRSERGSYCGTFDLLIQSALSIGPVVGGSITQELGWRWVFWFLVILSSTLLLIILLFVPETQRDIVGNGGVRPRRVYWTILTVIDKNRKAQAHSSPKTPTARRFPNPFSCLKILGHKASLIAIMLYSITYAVKMTIQASLGAQCVEIYRLNYLTAGLIYIPSGVGGAIAAFMSGKYIDKTYRAASNKTVTPLADDSIYFPIERVRLKGIYIMIITSAIETVGYGLALMTETHISVMIIMQFLIGFTTAPIFTMSATLLTDLNRQKSATAQGACSLIRCLMAGASIAAMQPLTDGAGLGWCFAVYGILLVFEAPLAWLLLTRGEQWRKHGHISNRV